MSELKPLGIYVHIPFCRSKCEYCDFYSLGGGRDRALMDRYLQAVVRHIQESGPRAADYEVDTIYFGGGTPSFFGADNLRRILGEIYKRFVVSRDAEITLEANPDSVTPHSLQQLVRSGFNRISIGVQSDSDEQLKALGRPHDFAQAQQAVADARAAGFSNLSVDLMYGLPSQSRDQWAVTLRHIIDLRPNHISCYGLKVEPGTRLYEYRHCANLPGDDMQADMYLYMVSTLEEFGFQQYEISNFAREGCASRHNLKYWQGGEYMSFGPSAASDFGGKRYTFVADIEAYITGVMEHGSIVSECETLPLRDRAGEYLMLRTRTADGLSAADYSRLFRMPFEPIEAVLQQYAAQGLAQKIDDRWRLTAQGFLLSNQIIVSLLEAQEQSVPVTKRR